MPINIKGKIFVRVLNKTFSVTITSFRTCKSKISSKRSWNENFNLCSKVFLRNHLTDDT